MRKFTFVKSLFLVLALLAGNVVWGQVEQVIYSTGFENPEGFTATQAYDNTTVKYQGPTSQQWGVIMGSAALADKITDSQSMQMRSYTSNTTVGAAYTNFNLTKMTKVTFKAKANYASASINAYYSTDGGANWSTATNISISTSAQDYTYTISATGEYDNVRIKIEHPTVNLAGRLTIDDVKIYGMLYLTAPTLTLNKATIPAMTAVNGTTDTETVNVNGALLTNDIVVSIDGADAAMFSVSPGTIAQSVGSASGTVTITYNPTAPGNHSATLKFNSTGATEVTRALTGSASMTLPVAIDGSGISNAGFTANWNAVPGAAEYLLNVYTKTGSGQETNTEDFSGITSSNGSAISSATYQTGWTVLSQSGSRQIYTTEGNYGAASPSLAFTTTGDYIETATYPGTVKSISFWAKQQTGATSTTLIEGYNGSTWVTIGTLSNADIATAATKTYDLVALNIPNIVKVKLVFTKALGNTSIDDIVITYSGGTNAQIAGSPFTVTGETSKAIGGLSSSTTYYYTVVAKSGAITTNASNEIAVTTSIGTDLHNTIRNMQIRAVNGNIVLNAEAGQLVEVYNSTGQKVVSRLTNEGINTIPARVKGVVFVRIGKEISKLIME